MVLNDGFIIHLTDTITRQASVAEIGDARLYVSGNQFVECRLLLAEIARSHGKMLKPSTLGTMRKISAFAIVFP